MVPPGGFVEVTRQRARVHRYWTFQGIANIRYNLDAEYEEHFRLLFKQSVRRRLRSAYPIVADLSGGLDSSSIVCMAFDLVKSGEANAKINTLSRYSLAEIGGDERSYILAVEEAIGQSGTHLEAHVGPAKPLLPLRQSFFQPLPGYFDGMLDAEQDLQTRMGHQGNRVYLRGHGGDELLGGVPDPTYQLASLLWAFQLPTFWSQLSAWALRKKTSVYSLLAKTFGRLAPLLLQSTERRQLPSWVLKEFVRGYEARRRTRNSQTLRGWLPGPPDRDNEYLSLAATLNGLAPPLTYNVQPAFPFLDRDLVVFLHAIPGDQILRPQERRSLMRRALKGILPESVRMRTTKWIGGRRPSLEVDATYAWLCQSSSGVLPTDKYFDPIQLQCDLDRMGNGENLPLIPFIRHLGTVSLGRSLASRHLLLPVAREMPSALSALQNP
jgi:asparagine synthase (glutamine-hydrolysing)